MVDRRGVEAAQLCGACARVPRGVRLGYGRAAQLRLGQRHRAGRAARRAAGNPSWSIFSKPYRSTSWTERAVPRSSSSPTATAGSGYCDRRTTPSSDPINSEPTGLLSSVVEHRSCKANVIGSIPIGGALRSRRLARWPIVASAHEQVCRGCGCVLSKRSQKLYCGNACQGSFRRKTLTKLWLESGEARIDSHQGHYIREYLVDAQSGCCAICGGTSVWLDLPLALVLDHIDGDPTNNRRENLRLVCPTATTACDVQEPEPRQGTPLPPTAIRRRPIVLKVVRHHRNVGFAGVVFTQPKRERFYSTSPRFDPRPSFFRCPATYLGHSDITPLDEFNITFSPSERQILNRAGRLIRPYPSNR